MTQKFYAVRVGRRCGIFTSWAECEKQIKGFPAAKFKSFGTQADAKTWLEEAVQSNLFEITRDKNENFSPGVHSAAQPNGQKIKADARRSVVPPLNAAESETISADYIIYTDGSCLRNPNGPGGWAAVIIETVGGTQRELSGGEMSTTNNRMELTAAWRALAELPPGATVELYTDSQYMKNGFTKRWLYNWKRNGWKTATGGEVLNQDLWRALDHEFELRRVTFRWVKGHAGIAANERCDKLARAEAFRFIHN